MFRFNFWLSCATFCKLSLYGFPGIRKNNKKPKNVPVMTRKRIRRRRRSRLGRRRRERLQRIKMATVTAIREIMERRRRMTDD